MALATMVRNPRMADLAEWAAYHLVRGVTRILIYNHGRLDGHSADFPARYEPLRVWCDEGKVEIHARLSPEACLRNGYAEAGHLSTPSVFRPQAMLVDAWLRLRDEFEWIGFIDHDEFVHTADASALPVLLESFAADDTAVLQLQMRRYGNSGHYLRPAGLVLENYTWRERDFPLDAVKDEGRRRQFVAHGNWTKSVVRPHRVVRPDYGNHSWFTVHGYVRQQLDPELGLLNHYFTRSVEDWIDSAMLGSAQGHPPHRNWGALELLAVTRERKSALIGKRLVVEDRCIQRHVTAVREELARVGIHIEPALPLNQEV